MRPLFACAVFAALALLSCAPETKQPVEVMALVRSEGGVYEPTHVQLRTLSDVVAIEGSVAFLRGGAQIVVDPADPLLTLNGGNLSDEQLMDVLVKNEGVKPLASYVEKDGVLWPADFHTWNMITSYRNLELAFDYFQALGVSGELLGKVRLFYFPSFVLRELSPKEQKDNALFFSPVQSLMVLPFEQDQEAPLAMNDGIMAHEYAHLVFNRIIYGGAALPAPLNRWGPTIGTATPQVNLLKALDEGLADFHAYVASCRTPFGCDTRYLENSLGEDLANARDLSKLDKCLSEGMQNALTTLTVGDFTAGGYEYQVGTVLAAALYHAGASPNDHELIAKTILGSYPDLGTLLTDNMETPENVTLEQVLDLFLLHMTSDELKVTLCNQFLGRVKAQRDLLPHCPLSSTDTLPDCPT